MRSEALTVAIEFPVLGPRTKSVSFIIIGLFFVRFAEYKAVRYEMTCVDDDSLRGERVWQIYVAIKGTVTHIEMHR